MKPSRAVLLSLLLVSTVAQADSVWAPGVRLDGGWVDYDKDRGQAPGNDDSLMCWAASSSNIITWWQNQQKETAIPKPDYTGSTWDFFSHNNGKLWQQPAICPGVVCQWQRWQHLDMG